jgi:colanic acid/amylovoran biosynthesis glycosyltransferase
MKIAFILGKFPVLSETFVVNQIAGVMARGCQVDILAMSPESTIWRQEAVDRYRLTERVRCLRAPRNHLMRLYRIACLLLVYGWRAPGPVVRSVNVARYGKAAASLGLLYAVLMIIRSGTRQYDVIHAQFGPYGTLALRLIETGALSGRVVTSFRGYDATKYLRARPRTYDELFRNGSLFLPVSRALANRIIEAGCDPSRVRVHHSGIECARIAFQTRSRVDGEPTRVIVVARLMEKKGIDYGIRAIAQVTATGRAVSCAVVGEGPLRPELERLVGELDLEAHVKLVGARSHNEVLELMAQSHILIAPSVTAADGDEEGIPNSIKEAMALGLPVVGTWHGGIPELVEDDVSGFLVPERDVDALADRLVYLIDHPGLWASMGRAGRRRIEAGYDIDKLNDELLGLYEGLVETPPSRTSKDMGHAVQHGVPGAVRRAGKSATPESARSR